MRSYRLLAGLLTGVYFFLLTRGALRADFSPDDTMNLYRSWSFPLSSLVRANLLFWQSSVFYRPLPAAWYRSIYFFAGYHSLPFHVADLIVLAANIYLTYAVARRLSDSYEVGMLAALLGCYHTSFASLYFDTGFIFDVLCYFFYFSAFLVYLKARQAGRPLRSWPLASTIGLYICALNSKEMAVTLPLFLGIYECLYHPPRAWTAKELRRWILVEGRGMLIAGAIALVFAIGRTTGANSLGALPDYAMVFTWQRVLDTSRHFLGELLFLPDRPATASVLLLWTAMFAGAWAAKSRTLWFAWLFLTLSPGPIAFTLRSAPQYYVPLFGWVLYAAATLAAATAWLARKISGPGAAAARYRAPLLFGALLLVLYPLYAIKGWANVDSVRREAPLMRLIVAQLHGLHPRIPPGARLFFLNDPISPAWENMIFIVCLSYGDDSIVVERMKQMPQRPTDDQLARYTYVFDYKGGRFIEMFRPWLPKPMPMITLIAQGAEVYHTGDWAQVAAGRAARPGEMLISKVIDLGPSAAQVEINVNGRRTDRGEFLPWPGEPAGTYRVDFRVPPGTAAGPAKVEVRAGSLTGPPAYIPVAGP